ncbi:MAG: fibrobacter succinogenes major paralogous domain-containing protein [Bacteroidia bacterium]|nr:fibrobacter succinogenes major paralogous domain-containing protein [Bacteroidia bacterium]
MKRYDYWLKLLIGVWVLLVQACSDGNKLASPELSTNAVSNITAKSVVCGGKISASPGSTVTEKGLCWSTQPNPTKSNSFLNLGSGMSNFTSVVNGLQPNTTYYIRAYAANSSGISYGNQESFKTLNGVVASSGGGVVDLDGNSYPSIVLGNGQEWMSENLRSAKFSNGDAIPPVEDSLMWLSLSTVAWSFPNRSVSFENPYGKLYNWYVVADSRNVCPEGWHVPGDSEWNELIHYLDSLSSSTALGVQSGTAGGRLKKVGTEEWLYPNTGASDEIGFLALPAGMRQSDARYAGFGETGSFWTSTQADALNAYMRRIYFDNSSLVRNYLDKRSAASIRCLKD